MRAGGGPSRYLGPASFTFASTWDSNCLKFSRNMFASFAACAALIAYPTDLRCDMVLLLGRNIFAPGLASLSILDNFYPNWVFRQFARWARISA